MISNVLFYLIFITYAFRPDGIRVSLMLGLVFSIYQICLATYEGKNRIPLQLLILYLGILIGSVISYLYYFGKVDKFFISNYVLFTINTYGFYLYFKLGDLKKIIGRLIKFQCYISVFAIVQQISFLLGFKYIYDLHSSLGFEGGSNISDLKYFTLYRVDSIFTEPSHFAYFISFGLFAGIKSLEKSSFFSSLVSKKQFVIIMVAFLMTFSFSMYFVLILFVFFTVLKPNFKSILIGGGIFFILAIVSTSEVVSTKINKIVNFNSIDVENSGATIFAIYSNAYITYKTLEDHNYIFGSGMNSHRLNYDKYIIDLIDKDHRLYGTNSVDASSMFLKILSDFGVLGLVLVLCFFIFYRVRGRYSDLSVVALFALISYMTRTGDYGSVVFTLFFSMYFAVYYLEKRKVGIFY
ncbi:MAG: hypothetical protein MJK11_14595 [Pseudomonadales bacterium]|nr:hypothetical protein [Pseudomonadales bacterium]